MGCAGSVILVGVRELAGRSPMLSARRGLETHLPLPFFRDLMPIFQPVLFIMDFVFRSMASAMSSAMEAAPHLLLKRSLTCEFK